MTCKHLTLEYRGERIVTVLDSKGSHQEKRTVVTCTICKKKFTLLED